MPANKKLTHLEQLEHTSIYILREAYANFKNICMLWSAGKDSTVLLWLARKAFYGRIPFPVIHIDTGHKHPEMIAFRDRLARKWDLDLRFGINENALNNKTTYPDGKINRIECCQILKTESFKRTIDGTGPVYAIGRKASCYKPVKNPSPFSAIILGIRSDEEGSRSKERYFSMRTAGGQWQPGNQAPELWNYYKTEIASGTHVRIHPLLDWTEINIWEYIAKEDIPVISLYFAKDSKRYRSLGCLPCISPICSEAKTPRAIVRELKYGKLSHVAERSGRAQDAEDGGGLETLRRNGYM